MDTAPALSPLAMALVAILWTGVAAADPPPKDQPSAAATAAASPKAPPAAASTDAVSRHEDSVTLTMRAGALQRALSVVTGSVGFAGMVVGGVFGILALTRWNDVKASVGSCRDPANFSGCPLQLRIDQRAASSYATVSTYGFTVGTAFIVGAATIWYLAPRRRKPAARIDFAPVLGPGGAGGLVTGAF